MPEPSKLNAPATKARLHKPVEALVMVPRSHKLSLLARKMYNVLLFLSQKELQRMEGLPLANHMFESKLTDILELCNANGQNTRAQLYLTEMQKCIVDWQSPDTTSEVRSISFALLSEARISQKKRVLWIHWGLPPSLYDALIDPRRWATIDLAILSKLTSYTAVALYEICSKFRANYNGLTSRNVPEWWADALSGSVPGVDEATGLTKKREWRKIKSESVQDAILEINEKTDLIIELLEHKGARGVVAEVQFRVKRKTDQKAEETSGNFPAAGSEIAMYADRLGVKNTAAINAMANEYGQDDLFSSLKKLELRQNQVNLPVVKSPEKYLNSLIGNQKPQEAIPVEAVKSPHINQVPVLVNIDVKPKSWITIKREKLFDEIMELKEKEQSKWVRKCVERLREAGSLTAAIERRASSNEWAVGMLKSSVIDLYALEIYGPAWNNPPTDFG